MTSLAIESVKYTDTVRTPQLKRDTRYAMKEWLEVVKGVSKKFRISAVTFEGASWNGVGMWLKDGELPMLKASDGLKYYFRKGDEQIVAHVQDRCLFLNNLRVTFSKLAEGEEVDASILDEAMEVNEVHPMDDEELTDALIGMQVPLVLASNPLDGELLEETKAPKAKKRK